jgi:HSP20 family molecular chaperone IbpA|tara:strand:- start:515 stop:1858 length:1344 start_codon:yes stop_codon:yes gene_type:complete
MLTTSLRPFHVLDASLAAELEDMFFDAVDSVLPSHSSFSSSVPRGQQSSQQEKRALSTTTTSWRGRQVQTRETNRGTMVKMNVPGVSARDVKVTLTGGCLRDSSKKEDESKLLSSIGVPTSLKIDFLGDEQQQAERGGGNNITIKLKRKATYDIENAIGLVCDGVLRVVVPKITLPAVDVKVASGEAERPPAEESEVTLKFAVAGYSSSDISVELDAERERLKIFGELKDKSSQFERVVPVPRGLGAEHVTLCAVENGVLELRLRDPLAIEKRIVPVFSTSPPPLPSPPSQEVAAQVNQPIITPTTIAGSEEEKKPTEQQDNRVVLMKTEVPGYSAKDIECCINVDRTIEAKRSNGRGVKIGIPNSINVDSIKAYCEHGIFQVLGETEPPFTPRSVAVDIAGPSEDAEKQKMLKQLEDMMVEEEEEENDAVLVNKKEGVEEEKTTSA